MPRDASVPLTNAPDVRDKIVVIHRGPFLHASRMRAVHGCVRGSGSVPFAVKARHAFMAQARAIIFVNSDDSPIAATDPNDEVRHGGAWAARHQRQCHWLTRA